MSRSTRIGATASASAATSGTILRPKDARGRSAHVTGALRDVGVRKPPRMGAPPVADLALVLEASRRLSAAPVGPLAAVDDHRHVRIVLVVLDHLVVELVRELARDHAVDHPARSVGAKPADATRGRSR